MPRLLLLLLLLTAALAGCTIPDDTDGTYEHIRGGTLRVGATESEPWKAVELALLRELARDLDAEVELFEGSEQELVDALKERDLDVVVGGITDKTRWAKEVAMTKPYVTTHLVIGTPDGSEVEDGQRVAVEAGTVGVSLVDKKSEGVPVPVESLRGVEGPAAVEEWLLDDLRLRRAGDSLQADEHVMLTGPGENRWLVTLERFLLDRKERALRLLDQEGRPE